MGSIIVLQNERRLGSRRTPRQIRPQVILGARNSHFARHFGFCGGANTALVSLPPALAMARLPRITMSLMIATLAAPAKTRKF